MKTFADLVEEIHETMMSSSGGISGMGYNIGRPDQPQVSGRDADDVVVKRKKKTNETFAGCPVFTVTSEDYSKSLRGRSKYERWSKRMNMEDINNQSIRSYSHKNPGQAVIIKDSVTGTMSYFIPPLLKEKTE
tara:strand:- start:297 stop:695 length:399 start_codon:yes stop_codon:yes gene_type:complete